MGRSRTFSGSNVSSNPHHPDFKGFKLIPNVRRGQDIVQLDEDHYLSIVSRAVNEPLRSVTHHGAQRMPLPTSAFTIKNL